MISEPYLFQQKTVTDFWISFNFQKKNFEGCPVKMPPWLPRGLHFTLRQHGHRTTPSINFRPRLQICSLCHTASKAQHPSPPPAHNTPSYTPLLKEIEQRRDEARRSILVQVSTRFSTDLGFGHINSVGQRVSLCSWSWLLLSRSLWASRGTAFSHKPNRF